MTTFVPGCVTPRTNKNNMPTPPAPWLSTLALHFAIGHRVWLSTKSIKTARPSKKPDR